MGGGPPLLCARCAYVRHLRTARSGPGEARGSAGGTPPPGAPATAPQAPGARVTEPRGRAAGQRHVSAEGPRAHERAASTGTVPCSPLWLKCPAGLWSCSRPTARDWRNMHTRCRTESVGPLGGGVGGDRGGCDGPGVPLPQVEKGTRRTFTTALARRAAADPCLSAGADCPRCARDHPSSGSVAVRAQRRRVDLPSTRRRSLGVAAELAQSSRRARTASSTRLP